MEIIFKAEKGKKDDNSLVSYELWRLGKDLLLLIAGGASHIGSIACSDKLAASSPVRQITLETHREDVIVGQAAVELKEIVTGEILVIGGVHYDDITPRQIERINANCRELLEQTKNYLLENL